MQTIQKKIAVLGSLTEDLFVSPHQTEILTQASESKKTSYMMLPYGGKISAEYIETHYGGGAANVAVSLSTWGFAPMVFGSVGGDAVGKRIIENLKNHRVQTNGIQETPEMKSGFSLILNAFDGERTVIFTPEANSHFYSLPESILEKFSPDAIHACHLAAPSEAPIRKSLEKYLADHPSTIFSWNPGKTDIALGIEKNIPLLSQCSILFLNAEEAEMFSGKTRKENHTSYGAKKRATLIPHEMADFTEVASVFLHQGTQQVVITDGRKGAVRFFLENTMVSTEYIPPIDSPRVSTLGAGDAFASGFLGALLMGKDLHFAGKYASMNAASVVGKRGAQEGILESI